MDSSSFIGEFPGLYAWSADSALVDVMFEADLVVLLSTPSDDFNLPLYDSPWKPEAQSAFII